MIEIRQYADRPGNYPFERWLLNQNDTARARITIALAKLEAGNFSAVKGSGAGVYEVRLDFGPGYRIYFGKDGEAIVILLGGGIKKRQQADIETARARWQQYKRGKREE